MGTAFAVAIEDDIDPMVVDEVYEWWADVERRFSTFIPESQISAIGRGDLDRADADPDVRHVLAVCDELEEATGGRFTMQPPDRPGIDPAGYVKGWSVDEAALILRGAGADNFCIYAGGDVLCSGRPSDDDVWRVGVRDPRAPDRTSVAIRVGRGAVATSAAYERGDHIWGASPGGSILSATVTGPLLGMADALATAVYSDGSGSLEWLGRFPDYQVLLIAADGRVRYSAALGDRLEGLAV